MSLYQCSRLNDASGRCIRAATHAVVIVLPVDDFDSDPETSELPIYVCGKHKDALKLGEILSTEAYVEMNGMCKRRGMKLPAYGKIRLDFKELP